MQEKIFEVHPHCGYLNTEYSVRNVGESEIVVSFNNDTDHYTLSPRETKTLKLTAGLHTFSAKREEMEQTETIAVKDALKFGGGQETAAYVSDKSKWSLVKMTDRLYFYNSQTNESFVEMSLTPESIEFLSDDLLLFYTSGYGYSVFSSINASRSILDSESAPVFRNEKCIVFIQSQPDTSFLLRVLEINGHIHEMAASAYMINQKTEELCLYKDNSTRIFSLISFEELATFTPNGEFITFLTECFEVVRTRYSNYEIYNLSGGKKCFEGKIYNTGDVVSIGTARKISEKDLNDCLQEREKALNAISSKAKSFLSVSVRYREMEEFYSLHNSLFYTVKEYSGTDGPLQIRKYLHKIGDNKMREEIPMNTSVIAAENNLLAYTYNSVIVVNEDWSTKKIDGKLYNVQGQYLIEEKTTNDDKRLISLTGEVIYDGNYESEMPSRYSYRQKINILEDYGLIVVRGEKNKYVVSVWNPSDRLFDLGITDVISNTLVEQTGSEIFIYINGEARNTHDTFAKLDNILAISESGNQVLGCLKDHRGNVTALFRYIWDTTSEKYQPEQILKKEFDSSFYKNVLFAGDGEYIVYSDSEGSYYCQNLSTGEVFGFENERFLQHVNGYRSEIRFVGNGAALPRVIDPVTGQFLDVSDMADYKFSSPDGKFSVEKPGLDNCAEDGVGYVEYINMETDEIIPKQDYLKLAQIYNLPERCTASKDLTRKRIEFMKLHSERYAAAVNREIADVSRWSGICVSASDILQYDSMSEGNKKDAIDYFAMFKDTDNFLRVVIETNEYILVRNRISNETLKIDIGRPLWFLNYISFSYDSRYIAIVGRYPDNTSDDNGYSMGGLFYLYDMQDKFEVARSTGTNAVWVSAFTKEGCVAYYDSTPITFFKRTPGSPDLEIRDRNFLTFSPSGKLFALSNQGYVRIDSIDSRPWGHQPCTNVYLRKTDNPEKEIAQYNDHGAQIENANTKTVCMVAFSRDDKKMLSVSDDGVVVVRNLNLAL
ncbi:MAG: hypothetical protein K6F98_07895 [Bacteroidales bacterium]|nr:hypothetical protein [Bacteroidales bacterium]